MSTVPSGRAASSEGDDSCRHCLHSFRLPHHNTTFPTRRTTTRIIVRHRLLPAKSFLLLFPQPPTLTSSPASPTAPATHNRHLAPHDERRRLANPCPPIPNPCPTIPNLCPTIPNPCPNTTTRVHPSPTHVRTPQRVSAHHNTFPPHHIATHVHPHPMSSRCHVVWDVATRQRTPNSSFVIFSLRYFIICSPTVLSYMKYRCSS
jgi:hypothetical protein